MSHTCHAEGCTRTVPPRLFACAAHWRMVPRHLQRFLWATYRPGQERDKRVTVPYLIAQNLCRLAIAEKEGSFAAPRVRAELGVRLRALLAEDAPDRQLSDAELIRRFEEALTGS